MRDKKAGFSASTAEGGWNGGSAGASAEAVREELEKILASGPFRNAERVSRFLRFVVERTIDGRADEIKEYSIASEVYDSSATYDSRSDSLVRVEGRRLRSKLHDYYAGEGCNDPIAIEIPKGSYRPVLVRREAPVRSRAPSRTVWVAVAAAALVIGVPGLFLIRHLVRDWPAVAVLPFSDYGPDGAEQLWADCIAEDITQALAESPRLRVLARTSAFQFRGHAGDVRDIGRRLSVGMIVEGTVQRQGGRYRIAVRLVNAKDGFDVWSETRDTDGTGIDSVGRALASGLARAMKADLPRTAPPHVPPAEAQDLLLQARYLAGKGGDENRKRALEKYERAVSLDPNYARAWGELARHLSLMAFQNQAVAAKVAPRAKSAALRAIELDGGMANPYLALARLAWTCDWNWNAAEAAWRRALELNPSFAAAHLSYGLALASRRRFPEALAQARRAVELDPLSYGTANDLGVVLYLAGRFDEAATHARRSISLAPESPYPHFLLGTVYAAQGRGDDAVPELKKAAAGVGRDSSILGTLGYAYARAGRRADAMAVLADLESDPESGYVHEAMIHTALGNRDWALALLEKSAERREMDFLFVGANPVFGNLRSQPRFSGLCARLGLAAR